jgi:hypothetical protein
MKPTLALLFTVALLLITAHRLPAPIQEVPESPTPAPASQITATPIAKLKPNRAAKPNVINEGSQSSTKRKAASPPTQLEQQPKFAGTWRGTLPFGLAGDLHLTLVVNNDGTSVTESGGLVGTVNFRATNDGKTVSWHSGILKEIAWALTPNPDGETALLAAKSPYIGSPSAVFRKASP